MEISFTELKEKEIVNVVDGKKLGRVIDILFDNPSGSVRGIVVPGEKKIFHKSDDIFIPLDKLKKIGDDVVLVSLQIRNNFERYETYQDNKKVIQSQNSSAYRQYSLENNYKNSNKGQSQSNNVSYIRYRRIDNRKYK